jgi:hypothetical protein
VEVETDNLLALSNFGFEEGALMATDEGLMVGKKNRRLSIKDFRDVV